ncbi:MAG TPA: alkaline phosphatase family protein [Gemmatimonadaceae bacterium]|nr:alkaline phosphatase family protein [Gemmatimonadaceae bacterium]
MFNYKILIAGLLGSLITGTVAAQGRRGPPPIKHVFVIVLENTGYDTTFRDSSNAPYLADTLRKQGALLRQYHGTGHVSLDNYIAMISGLAPTRETQIDCPRFIDFVDTASAKDGQPAGYGCVYPARIQTVADQLDAKGLTWKAYMEDMGATPTREPATCAHPVIGSIDSTSRATALDNYATKHNPFVYFHSIIDTPRCQQNVGPLTGFEQDLQSAATTANFNFISPSLCHDGHDHPCRNGEAGGLISADEFLRHWVPIITASPAFRADGLLIITFDEALTIDATACCHEQPGPNVLRPGINGPGGGRIGAVLLSRYIKPGTVSKVPYNHYSLLRSVEDIFGLPHLGYASQKGLSGFGSDVFTRPRGK